MDYYFYNTDADCPRHDGGFAILIKKSFAATSGPIRFGEELGRLSPGDTLLMYENRVGVVAIGTVLKKWDGKPHKPSQYYMPGDDGFDYEYRIGVKWFLDLSSSPISVHDLKTHASTPRGAIDRVVKWRSVIENMIEERSLQSHLPEQVTEPSRFVEGAVRQISVNAYERNPAARSACIAHYGPSCVVCGFNFGKKFGPAANGYIHVHHLKPLAEIGEKYEVDPVVDLRPVCPNCHAVIHLDGASRSINEVKKLMAKKGCGHG
jgi:hypothetical protein